METLTPARLRVIALIGNPNSGKSAIFNALTGLRQKVANYPGVTVEKREGSILFDDGVEGRVIDLPGTYSLTASSPDEQIAVDVLLGRIEDLPRPDLIVCVADASNLERNLFLVSQIIDYHLPLIVALNMMDVASEEGIDIDIQKLSEELGVRVIPTVAHRRIGIDELKSAVALDYEPSGKSNKWNIAETLKSEWEKLSHDLEEFQLLPAAEARHEAMALLAGSTANREEGLRYDSELARRVRKGQEKLGFLGIDVQAAFAESRYLWIKSVCDKAVNAKDRHGLSATDRIDQIVTHKVWGFVIFFGLMVVMFQMIFSWANAPMELIGKGFDWLGAQTRHMLPPGDLQNLMVNGALAGVGAVVTFLPQIAFLFFFLALLEDSGYMARAAFIMDRVMGKVGLHGRAFIPLLSSFACAIPGIMATRTIDSRKDRLVTMLVAPLMSCSARLPVYALLIAAFIPQRSVLGVFSLPGLTMIGLYLFGVVTALIMAWVFKKTILKGEIPAFIMELPPYKVPSVKSVLLVMSERSLIFLKRAGTFILGVSIILWFLATYPKIEHGSSAQQLEGSFAGRAGHLIEPLIKPLGFDWQIGIGLVSSVLQREVFVSTMGTIYNIQDANEQGNISLGEHLKKDINPDTGKSSFTILTALCLMVYYLLSMQCMSTIAVMRRETNGWKWPLFQFGYMTVLAYSVTFIVYRLGLFAMRI